MTRYSTHRRSRWLIIGGAGFIGGHLVDVLASDTTVVVVDNFSTGNYRNASARYLRADVRERARIAQIIKSAQPDVIVGAWTLRLLQCLENPQLGNAVNSVGALNILEGWRKTDALFVLLSTGSVYGHGSSLNTESCPTFPNTVYVVSKLATESYVNSYSARYGLESVILRLHSVYGPRQDHSRIGGVVSIFVNKCINNKPPIVYGNGRQTRPFLFVQDAVKAIIRSSAIKAARGLTINVAGEKAYSINELAAIVLKNTSKKIKPIYTPYGNRPHVMHFRPSLERAHKILHFTPRIDLETGLRITIDHFRSQS